MDYRTSLKNGAVSSYQTTLDWRRNLCFIVQTMSHTRYSHNQYRESVTATTVFDVLDLEARYSTQIAVTLLATVFIWHTQQQSSFPLARQCTQCFNSRRHICINSLAYHTLQHSFSQERTRSLISCSLNLRWVTFPHRTQDHMGIYYSKT